MEELWQKCVDGQCDVTNESSHTDIYKILGNDFSYVLSKNQNTGQHNIIDTLTVEQRKKHPKFIHETGIVGKFSYRTRVSQLDTSEKIPQLCTKNMTGIFRFGPAKQGYVNILGFGFKFFDISNNQTTKESIYNTLMIGGSAEKIDPMYPPKISDIKFYSTDISSIDTKKSKKVNFLTHSFMDLITNPNIINVSKFVTKYKCIFFEFNPQLMKQFENVIHDDAVVHNIKNIINTCASEKTNYVLGTIFAIYENTGYKIELGDIILLEPVIISNYANSHLFFQHDLDNILPKKVDDKHVLKSDDLNVNSNSQSMCLFAQRIKHFLS